MGEVRVDDNSKRINNVLGGISLSFILHILTQEHCAEVVNENSIIQMN